ncbi:Chromate resistance exported protein [Roseovarius litorisediminis]|uniref:Chromate resistance exported protein n=1 Tax=Roseovarius litorisediminis TaxID=1312363 RepID=A0A1Y5TEH8_9RHOB|nr:sulfurtransferase/chromate resistance protein [Roseovarius litorisediminis]SLN62464.1 Chromate resistance exported protein [Roseovarius litorisediminis]
MPAPNEITPQKLLRLIGTPDRPVIVDISIDPDFDADPYLIPGSIRHRYDDIFSLINILDGEPCVVACQKGRKLSQGLAALLRSHGISADYLSGGIYGWRDTPEAPRIPAAAIPNPVGDSTLWVTRHRPKIDRIACPWLIRRFVDPNARFLFVSPSEVEDVACRFGAVPFDIEGVFWSHRDRKCTFDTMLEEFGLQTDALLRLAKVIRGADTDRHDLTPQSAGLLALSVGLSRQFRDDNQQLETGLGLYDALYRWARDGYEEGHQWPTKQAQGNG